MPPKKSAKESLKNKAAAELKKKNAELADSIIETLMQETRESNGAEEAVRLPKIVSKTASEPVCKDGVSTDVTVIKTLSKKQVQKNDVGVKKKNSHVTTDAYSGSTSSTAAVIKTPRQNYTRKTASESKTKNKSSFILPKLSQRSYKTSAVASTPTSQSTSDDAAKKSSDKATVVELKRKRNTEADEPTSKRSAGNSTTTVTAKVAKTQYVYEIDCARVLKHVNPTDLQNYLRKELKVDGLKNNLNENVVIDCRDQKIEITSNVYLPKRSLRFLSKKFIKKNWNIQVVSSSTYAYEFKYVGTM